MEVCGQRRWDWDGSVDGGSVGRGGGTRARGADAVLVAVVIVTRHRHKWSAIQDIIFGSCHTGTLCGRNSARGVHRRRALNRRVGGVWAVWVRARYGHKLAFDEGRAAGRGWELSGCCQTRPGRSARRGAAWRSHLPFGIKMSAVWLRAQVRCGLAAYARQMGQPRPWLQISNSNSRISSNDYNNQR
eukprot:351729-Chlamydomonas_euryale.AAC.6